MKKTTLKAGAVEKSHYYIRNIDGLEDLENSEELSAILHEYRDQLSPCTHCGYKYPDIRYCYQPGNMLPHKILPSGELAMKEYPHEIYAVCSRRSIYQPPEEQGCNIRTQEWFAEDDESDFREALRRIVAAWNRRPE